MAATDVNKDLWELYKVVSTYPAIDNHAHAFLKPEYKDSVPFEGLISEANGAALTADAVQTLACYRATAQLAKLFGLPRSASWEDIKRFRAGVNYEELCRICMAPTRIQCILIDDGLGTAHLVNDYKWHDRFTSSPTKRIVRVEVEAEGVLKQVIASHIAVGNLRPGDLVDEFVEKFKLALTNAARDPEVVGFKSIACYRTGLDIALTCDTLPLERIVTGLALLYEMTKDIRLADKPLNDYVVCTALRIAGECGKPVQFHTGLGDNDLSLSHATPALLQPVIKAFPRTKFVLLHSSYPYTREAGYLTAVYQNVYLDFGEIFPFLSAEGQRDVFKQVLELAPINKIMWSTDGHYWPESYYLGSFQAREVVFHVLEGCIRRDELTLAQAINIVRRAFFDNANGLYNLGLVLQPHIA